MNSSNDRVTTAIRAHLGMRRLSVRDLERMTGMTYRTLARRVAEGGWTLDELDSVAAALGLPIADLIVGVLTARSSLTSEDGPTHPYELTPLWATDTLDLAMAS